MSAGQRVSQSGADGQPVAVGGGERHRVAVDFEVDPGQQGQRVVTAGGRRDLAATGAEYGSVMGIHAGLVA